MFFTQESQPSPAPMSGLSIEAERVARLRAEEAAAKAVEDAKEAKERVKALENDMQTVVVQFQECMQALERQAGLSSSSSRQSLHPHYDDDLDDQSLDDYE